MTAPDTAPAYDAGAKQKSSDKVSRIPVKVVHTGETLKKPDWIRVKAGSPTTRFYEIKDVLRANKLVTVCERYGVALTHAHDALHDTRATAEILICLLKAHGIEDPAELVPFVTT